MTPGAGTAQSVSRVGRRQMWRVAAGLRFCCGRFAALRRSSGRHKWRPYVCGRSNVVLRWSSGRHKWRPYVCGRSNVVLRWSSGRHKWRPCVCGAVDCCFAVAGSRRSVGHPGVTSGAPTFAGRSTVVLRWLVCGVVRRGAIYDARCRNGTIGRPRWVLADVACCGRFVVLLRPVRGFASVIRVSQVAPVRLRGGRLLFCGGRFAA